MPNSGFPPFCHATAGGQWQLRVMGLVGQSDSQGSMEPQRMPSCSGVEVVFLDLCLHSSKTTVCQGGMVGIFSCWARQPAVFKRMEEALVYWRQRLPCKHRRPLCCQMACVLLSSLVSISAVLGFPSRKNLLLCCGKAKRGFLSHLWGRSEILHFGRSLFAFLICPYLLPVSSHTLLLLSAGEGAQSAATSLWHMAHRVSSLWQDT